MNLHRFLFDRTMHAHTTSFTPVVCLILILACAVISAGCTSPAAPAVTTPVPATTIATPVPATVQASVTPAAPVTTAATPAAAQLTTVSISNGVTITYPSDWQKEELSQSGFRDYGRTTTNIANFYSPDITPDLRAKDITNPDKSTYTTLSIDVDPETVTDFEHYFNLVTLGLQKTYGSITITKHNYQLKVSGYDAYEMDFDAKTGESGYLRGSYIFVDADGTIYIFAFRNPTPYSAEIEDMYKSITIGSSTGTVKHR